MKVGEQLREMWRQATRRDGQGRDAELAAAAQAERKTLALPAILSPVQFPGRHLPKPTPANLRRFAETPWCGGRSTLSRTGSRPWTGRSGQSAE